MTIVISILVAFFATMLLWGIFQALTQPHHPHPYASFTAAGSTICEGMEDMSGGDAAAATTDPTTYDEYSPGNAAVLSQKNAANIQYLKSRVDDVSGSNEKMQQHIFDLSANVTQLSDQVDQISAAQVQYLQQTAPTEMPAMDLTMPGDNGTTIQPQADTSIPPTTTSTGM